MSVKFALPVQIVTHQVVSDPFLFTKVIYESKKNKFIRHKLRTFQKKKINYANWHNLMRTQHSLFQIIFSALYNRRVVRLYQVKVSPTHRGRYSLPSYPQYRKPLRRCPYLLQPGPRGIYGSSTSPYTFLCAERLSTYVVRRSR